jgi:hypothetical protein
MTDGGGEGSGNGNIARALMMVIIINSVRGRAENVVVTRYRRRC